MYDKMRFMERKSYYEIREERAAMREERMTSWYGDDAP